jgi:type VI secretion system protein ImpH
MTRIEKINELLRKLQLDIRLEVVLADLISDGLSLEDVIIKSNSLFKRNYHHDIEKTEEVEYGHSRKKKLSIFVNREGIYDGLPEDLFHQPTDSKNETSKAKVIQEIKVQNEYEKSSRLFFLPFEQEFYRQRIKLESEERKFLFETNSDLSGDLFDQLWGFPDFLDSDQKSKLGVLMPVLNQLACDREMMAHMMHILTGDPVSVRTSPPGSHRLSGGPSLGDMRIGVDTVLGGTIFEMQDSLTMTIFIEHPELLADYLPGGKKIIIHEFLCNLFAPFEKEITIELDISQKEVPFVLEEPSYHFARLNYTTTL